MLVSIIIAAEQPADLQIQHFKMATFSSTLRHSREHSEVYGNSVFYRKQSSKDSDQNFNYVHVASSDRKLVKHTSHDSVFGTKETSGTPAWTPDETCSISLEYHNFIVEKLNEQTNVYKKEIEALTATLKDTLNENAVLSDFVFQIDEVIDTSRSSEDESNNSTPSLNMSGTPKLHQVASCLDTLKRKSKLFSIKYGFLEKTVVKNEGNEKTEKSCSLSLGLSPILKYPFPKYWIMDSSGLPTVEPRSLKHWARRGVPSCDRKTLWRFLIHEQILKNGCSILNEHDYYSYSRRTDILDEKTKHQIELDVCRCLTNNICYQSETKQLQLADILRIFSILNPRISYCQSFSRIAAFALLILPEFEAFLAFEQIVCHILPPDYYLAPMTTLMSDLFAFKHLIRDKLPNLAKHFAKLQIDPQVFALSWFHSLFVTLFPVDVILLLWDSFLTEGHKVLFRIGLAVLWTKQKQILEIKEGTDLLCFLSKLDSESFDISQTRRYAFKEVNPLSEETINSFRNQNS